MVDIIFQGLELGALFYCICVFVLWLQQKANKKWPW